MSAAPPTAPLPPATTTTTTTAATSSNASALGAIPAAGDRGLVSPRAKQFLAEGLKLLGAAASRIVTRTLAWGALGLLLGFVVGVACLATGALAYPAWPAWRYVAWLVAALYPVAGAFVLGYAGVMRGVGRTMLHVGVERGLVAYLTDRVLAKVTEVLRRVPAIASALDRGEDALANLPLGQAEDALKRAVSEYVSSDDLEAEVQGMRRRVLRAVKRRLVGLIERFLLAVVRAEAGATGGAGGGGVSLAKVRALAVAKVEGSVAELVMGFMNKQLLLAALILAPAFALVPVVLAVLRARGG